VLWKMMLAGCAAAMMAGSVKAVEKPHKAETIQECLATEVKAEMARSIREYPFLPIDAHFSEWDATKACQKMFGFDASIMALDFTRATIATQAPRFEKIRRAHEAAENARKAEEERKKQEQEEAAAREQAQKQAAEQEKLDSKAAKRLDARNRAVGIYNFCLVKAVVSYAASSNESADAIASASFGSCEAEWAVANYTSGIPVDGPLSLRPRMLKLILDLRTNPSLLHRMQDQIVANGKDAPSLTPEEIRHAAISQMTITTPTAQLERLADERAVLLGAPVLGVTLNLEPPLAN
jgi:hypothetical protein